MTYEEAKIYINYIKVILDKEGLLKGECLEAMNTALQALDYEAIPVVLSDGILKGKKLAVMRN